MSGRSRHGAPERNTQKMPLRRRRSSTRGLLGTSFACRPPLTASARGGSLDLRPGRWKACGAVEQRKVTKEKVKGSAPQGARRATRRQIA
jgi:hypothetical protein